MFNIILPTYNESENILCLVKMLEEIFENLNLKYKIIIIDDGSVDGTQQILLNYKNINVKFLFRKSKLGLGSAYMYALKYCCYDFTIIMDADLSHDPFYIRKMIDLQNKTDCDIVSSSRYISHGGVYGWSFYRKLVSRGANNFAKLMLNLKTSDLTGSFRLYKTNVLKDLLESSSSIGYSIQAEIICKAERRNLKIEECPIIFYERVFGISKLGTNEIFKFIIAIFSLLIKKDTF